MGNYYKILEVKNFASFEEIKTAHRKLAMKFHPDKNDGDKISEEKFKEIQIAYEILSDLNSRSRYDEILIRSLQNNNLNLNISSKTPQGQRPRRESPYVFEKGRWRKRWRF